MPSSLGVLGRGAEAPAVDQDQRRPALETTASGACGSAIVCDLVEGGDRRAAIGVARSEARPASHRTASTSCVPGGPRVANSGWTLARPATGARPGRDRRHPARNARRPAMHRRRRPAPASSCPTPAARRRRRRERVRPRALPREGDGLVQGVERVAVHGPDPVRHHILNTPNAASRSAGRPCGALSEADSARPSTRRVSAGAMTPSSHRRAVEK